MFVSDRVFSAFSRSVYKDRQSLESDPAAWPATAKRWSRPYSSCCDRDLELGKRSSVKSAQTRSRRAIAGGRFLGFRGLFLRLRRLRHLDAIHLREPAALEVIDAGPWAALITQDRGA